MFGRAAVSSSRPCAAELASRAGAVKDARKRARQGLSLTAPSTAPVLGVVGTRKAPALLLVVGEPMRTQRHGAGSVRMFEDPDPAPQRNRREHDGTLDRRRVKQRALRTAHQTP